MDGEKEQSKLRLVELFAGIGAQAMALENLGIPFTSVVCEIDEKAYKSYCAIHGDTPNLGDITKVEHLPECDLLTYSFPCQDISLAGRKKGFTKGDNTRSGLLWEVERLLLDMKERGCLPETLLMENVDAIINENNMPDFNKWIASLSDMGYTSSYQVMNAKDYGVPQNRKRCFMVSCLNGKKFKFPKPCPDGRVLKDILEKDVDESYYLSDEKVAKYEAHGVRQREKGNSFGWEPTEGDEEAHAITTKADRQCGNFIKTPDEKTGLISDGNLDEQFTSDRYVYSPEGMSPTLLAKNTCNARIRLRDEENGGE